MRLGFLSEVRSSTIWETSESSELKRFGSITYASWSSACRGPSAGKAGLALCDGVRSSTIQKSLRVGPLFNLDSLQGFLLVGSRLVDPYQVHRRDQGGQTRVLLERLHLTVNFREHLGIHKESAAVDRGVWADLFLAGYHHEPHQEQ